MTKLYCVSFIIFIGVMATGCERSLESTAQGTVTLNGKLLSSGMVWFHPLQSGAVAQSQIQPNGSYQICTGASRGLAPGEYIVTVKAMEVMTSELSANLRPPKPIAPLRYGDVKTTDLRCTVKPGANRNDLTLKP